MAFDALKILEGTGAPIERLPVAMRDVFSQLSPNEVAILTSIQAKLDAVSADPEVLAQGDVANNLC